MGLTMRLASLLTTLVIVGAAICLPSIKAQELKLDDAIQLALEHNRQLAIQKLEVAKASEQISSLHTKLLPSVHFSADLSQQLRPIEYTIKRGELGEYPGIGPIPYEDVKLGTPMQPTGSLVTKVTQPLSGI